LVVCSYVQLLLIKLRSMIEQIHQRRVVAKLPLPSDAEGIIIDRTIRHVADRLVDAYSKIKKCSNEGRAMMQLDVQMLQVGMRWLKLNELLRRSVSPLPHGSRLWHLPLTGHACVRAVRCRAE
jgi:hypothetical protein